MPAAIAMPAAKGALNPVGSEPEPDSAVTDAILEETDP
jgi:hypothetical protein